MTYEPGDALGIYPSNARMSSISLLQALHFKGDEQVQVDGKDIVIHDAFIRCYEITIITRPMLQKYALLAKNKSLDQLLDDNHKKELNDYLYGHEIVDLIANSPANLSPRPLSTVCANCHLVCTRLLPV